MLYSGHLLFHRDVIAQSLAQANRAFVAWLKLTSAFVFWQKLSYHLHITHACSSTTSSSSTSPSCTTSQYTLPINKHCDDPQNEEYGSVAKTISSTSYEPNVIDNFDYSETYTAIFQNESVDIDTEPSYWLDAELDDELIDSSCSARWTKSSLIVVAHGVGCAPVVPCNMSDRENPAAGSRFGRKKLLSLAWQRKGGGFISGTVSVFACRVLWAQLAICHLCLWVVWQLPSLVRETVGPGLRPFGQAVLL